MKLEIVEHKRVGKTDLYMLLAVVLWAVNFSFIKIALREFSPLAFNGIRMIIASLTLGTILLITREGLSIPKGDVWKLALLGLTGNTIFQLLFIHGIDLTTASNSSIIMAMGPVFISLLSVILKHEKIYLAAWFGILISFVGFYMVISSRSGALQISGQTLRGDFLIFSANLFWAFYTVFGKPMLEKISPLKLTSLAMMFGTVFFVPFCARDLAALTVQTVSGKAWILLVYSSIFALVICYVVWYSSVRSVGSSKTAIYGNLVPIFAVGFAYFFLSERITLFQAGGAVIIFIGVYLTRAGYRYFYRNSAKQNSFDSTAEKDIQSGK